MLEDVVTGKPREVDVVIVGSIAEQRVTVSLECRDRSRPASVGWIEEMQNKHSRLPTNVLVLVSHKTFSAEALKVAGLYGIRCLVFEDIDSGSPERLFAHTNSLLGKALSVSIQRVEVTVAQSGDLPSEWFRAAPDTQFLLTDGTELCSAAELANALLRSRGIADKLLSDALPEHKFIEAGWRMPTTPTGRLCVQKMEPLVLRPVELVRVIASSVVAVEEFPLRHGHLGNVKVAWGVGALLGQPAMVVATAVAAGAPRVSLNLDGAGSPKENGAKL